MIENVIEAGGIHHHFCIYRHQIKLTIVLNGNRRTIEIFWWKMKFHSNFIVHISFARASMRESIRWMGFRCCHSLFWEIVILLAYNLYAFPWFVQITRFSNHHKNLFMERIHNVSVKSQRKKRFTMFPWQIFSAVVEKVFHWLLNLWLLCMRQLVSYENKIRFRLAYDGRAHQKWIFPNSHWIHVHH